MPSNTPEMRSSSTRRSSIRQSSDGERVWNDDENWLDAPPRRPFSMSSPPRFISRNSWAASQRLSTVSSTRSPRPHPVSLFSFSGDFQPELTALPAVDRESSTTPTPKTSKTRTFFLISALWLTVFLVALDQNIISPAIPEIASDFNSWDTIGWYGSAYLLTTCALQLLYGSLYARLAVKPIFIGAIILFEAGSLLCALAPNSTAFIIGRAIAGCGCAGIYSGALVTISESFPPEKQPVYTGIIGTNFGLASVAGPLLGGAFTDGPGWPWCFYINLPIGGVATVILLFAFRLPSAPKKEKFRFSELISLLNPISLITLIPGLVCLLVAFQLGGTTKTWSDPELIGLLTAAGVLLTIFILVQIPEKLAMIPHSIVKQKSIAAAMLFAFTSSSAFFTVIYYLPIWFQLVHGDSAVLSGVHVIPTLIAMIFTALIAAVLTQLFGPFQVFMIIASVFMSVAAGVLITMSPQTEIWFPIGLQILFGAGFGFAVQQPIIAVQNLLVGAEVPVGLALTVFSQSLGGAIFIPIAANRFSTRLEANLQKLLGPGQDAGALIAGQGGGELDPALLRQHPQLRPLVNDALMQAFLVAVPLAAIAALVGLGVRYKRGTNASNRNISVI